MRGRLSIFLFVAAMLLLLVGLNAASYVRVEREPELEAAPDRSTTNAGPSGTRALYEFLEESGHKVMRWREEPRALTADGKPKPATFVVVGQLRREFTEEEAEGLLRWVGAGGRLVLIDRVPQGLLPVKEEVWRVAASVADYPPASLRADDVAALTARANTVAPTQPSLLTRDVDAVAPSRFAGRLSPQGKDELEVPAENDAGGGDDAGEAPEDVEDFVDQEEELPSEPSPAPTTQQPAPQPSPVSSTGPGPSGPVAGPSGPAPEAPQAPQAKAPVFYLADERGALLADYAYGRGRIVVLGDSFIVANRGLSRADNLQLAVNVVAGAGGLIAFDEWHQGRGAAHNRLAAYFAGTPVLALCAQLLLLAVAFVWSRGRRFARPLPAPRPDRRSKLEFVASMAELQQRARAYDLAVENVYGRTRRALARYGGVDAGSPRTVIAAHVAARSGLKADGLEALMRECEDAINGENINGNKALELVAQLRELERRLGIRMRAREIKQAARLEL